MAEIVGDCNTLDTGRRDRFARSSQARSYGPGMTTNPRFGYALSSEEHRPLDLVAYARRAEEAGFEFAMLSDHFHPWTDRQGQSPFAWSVLGGIAATTDRITVGTGVTALSIRIHPAILAQAAATIADMLPGRFWFGVGTGENLNEHVLGDPWPEHAMRAAMLEEAVALIRRLWTGELVDHDGDFYRVSRARLYTLPAELPPIMIAAGGDETAALAGRIGDGLITTKPDKALLKAYGKKGPKLGQVSVCWAKSHAAAKRTALEWWPTAAIPGDNSQELPLPSSFEALAELVTEDAIAERVACGPDPDVHIEKIKPYLDAGFDHVYLHQVGPDQEGFLRFAEAELLPRLRGGRAKARKAA
jgi:coenzyme F420-dependent glucose-6-phosphate dehydrogenase